MNHTDLTPPDRITPQDISVERTVLGSMMIDSKCIAIGVDLMDDDYFYSAQNRIVFMAIREMFSEGRDVDITLLANHLQKKGELEAVGSEVYLAELGESIGTFANIKSYIDILKDKRDRRAGILLHTQAINALYDDDESSGSEICQRSVAGILGLSTPSKNKIVRMGEILPQVFDRVEAISGGSRASGDVKTGYPSIDQNVFFKKGFLHILAGRPSMGKTAVADCWMRNMAMDGNVILKFNFESSVENDVTRNLFSQSRLSLHDLNRGIIKKDDFPKLSLGSSDLYDLPIYVDSFSGNTPTRMYSSCLQIINRVGRLDVVIIDHLQLVPPDTAVPGNRNAEVGMISRQLMFLAERFDVVVIALSQLSRPPKGASVRPPALSDLRESGEIEQNAEVVMFLHRDEYYQMPKGVTDDTRDKVDFIYAKQKNGPTGCRRMGYIKKWFLLTELDTKHDDRDAARSWLDY